MKRTLSPPAAFVVVTLFTVACVLAVAVALVV